MSLYINIYIALYTLIAVIVASYQVWALVDIARRSDAAIAAVSKQTKGVWLAVLVTCTVLNVLSIPAIGIFAGLGLMVFFGITPALHYLYSIRPVLNPRRTTRPTPAGGGW